MRARKVLLLNLFLLSAITTNYTYKIYPSILCVNTPLLTYIQHAYEYMYWGAYSVALVKFMIHSIETLPPVGLHLWQSALLLSSLVNIIHKHRWTEISPVTSWGEVLTCPHTRYVTSASSMWSSTTYYCWVMVVNVQSTSCKKRKWQSSSCCHAIA